MTTNSISDLPDGRASIIFRTSGPKLEAAVSFSKLETIMDDFCWKQNNNFSISSPPRPRHPSPCRWRGLSRTWRHSPPARADTGWRQGGWRPGGRRTFWRWSRTPLRPPAAELQTKVRKEFTISEKAPTRAFSWLRVPNNAFTFTACLALSLNSVLNMWNR